MIVPVILLVASLAVAVASLFFLGPVLSGPFLISLLCAVAALLILLRERKTACNWIVVDGSNVMHWERDTPDVRSVFHVIVALKTEGYVPIVWFDANAGYLIGDRYMGPAPLARLIGLSERQVFIAPKGTPADPLLLKDAVALKARVVTNDRYRDWEEQFPQIREKGFLVRGRVQRDEFELELGE
jgi:hypothetical protein